MAKSVPLWLKLTVLTVLSAHLAFAIFTVESIGNKIPIADEWHPRLNADLAVRIANGQFNVDDLFATYRGHRLLTSLSLTALNTLLFRYDPRFEMWISAGLLVLNFSLTALLMRWLLGGQSPRLFWLSLIPVAALTFSGRNWIAWVWGVMTVWQFAVVLTLLAILIALRWRLSWHTTLLLTVLCTLVSFSFGAGVLAFGVVGMVLFTRRERHLGRWAVFGAAALFCSAALFVGERQAASSLTISPLANLLSISWILGAVQLSVPRSGVTAAWTVEYNHYLSVAFQVFCVAIAIFALNAWRLRRVAAPKLIAPSTLVLWSLGFALAISLTRGNEITTTFQADYYTPLQVQFWLGCLSASFLALQHFPKRALAFLNSLFIAFVTATHVAFTVTAFVQVITPQYVHMALADMRECALTALLRNDSCRTFRILPQAPYETAYQLARLRLSVFSDVAREPVTLALAFVPLHDADSAAHAFEVSDKGEHILFQRTTRLMQSLALPDLPDYRFTLRGALTADAACAEQSVKARLIVDDGKTQRVAVEQTVTADLVPFALDLTDWRGRALSLLYEVDTSEPLTCGHVLWANPRIEFSLASAQTAHR
ncbi:MAG: hypothetical protein RML95_06650 [Anaerolineae bacterium]|nr:hypothetical protein [Anaerolineae bacterium]